MDRLIDIQDFTSPYKVAQDVAGSQYSDDLNDAILYYQNVYLKHILGEDGFNAFESADITIPGVWTNFWQVAKTPCKLFIYAHITDNMPYVIGQSGFEINNPEHGFKTKPHNLINAALRKSNLLTGTALDYENTVLGFLVENEDLLPDITIQGIDNLKLNSVL